MKTDNTSLDKASDILKTVEKEDMQSIESLDKVNETFYAMADALDIKLPYRNTEEFMAFLESGEPLVL